MDGLAQGEGDVVLLNMERLFGGVDDFAKPFQRDALIIRNITERMAVFTIGGQQFIGLFEGDTLALSGDGLSGTVRLDRLPR
ncbi:hypothetical protein ASE61_11650 [Bosea sp. Root670]|nr:hypothetical protein ASE61_11650 [Bosea sp. Root670]